MTAPRPAHAMTDRDLLFAALGEAAIALQGAAQALGIAVTLAQRAGVAAGDDSGTGDADDDGIHFAGESRQANGERTTNRRA